MVSPTFIYIYIYIHIFTLAIPGPFRARGPCGARRKSRLSVIGRALRGRRQTRREVSPSVAAMTESLALVSGLLKRVGAAGMGGGSVSSTVYAMGEAMGGEV